jgi:hypothetical protein
MNTGRFDIRVPFKLKGTTFGVLAPFGPRALLPIDSNSTPRDGKGLLGFSFSKVDAGL